MSSEQRKAHRSQKASWDMITQCYDRLLQREASIHEDIEKQGIEAMSGLHDITTAVNLVFPQEFGGLELEFDHKHEWSLLQRFRRFAYSHLRPGAGEWEALFLARHYGLPTRILDWSRSPLVATYFACNPRAHKPADGVVWGMLRVKQEEHDLDMLKPPWRPLNPYADPDKATAPVPWDTQPKAIKLVYPVYNSVRLIAQKGVFTWHSQPQISLYDLKDQEFDDDKLDIEWLVKWPLKFADRVEVLRDLENQVSASGRSSRICKASQRASGRRPFCSGASNSFGIGCGRFRLSQFQDRSAGRRGQTSASRARSESAPDFAAPFVRSAGILGVFRGKFSPPRLMS
jgi:hypothetical protein